MIEWHKAKDELPPYEMPILVASKCGKKYPEEIMFVMQMIARNDNGNICNMWEWVYNNAVFPIYEDDRWAIINQQKIEKDGDSD